LTVAAFGTSMRIQIQLRIVADDDSVISEGEILHLDKGDDRLEVIGLSFDEAKAILAGIQGGVVTAQAASFLARHRSCDLCGSPLLSKGPGRTQFRTAFGTIALSSPRFHRCRCQPGTAKNGGFEPSVSLDKTGKVVASTSETGTKDAIPYTKAPVNGVLEPSAYQGTMFLSYQSQAQINLAISLIQISNRAYSLITLDLLLVLPFR